MWYLIDSEVYLAESDGYIDGYRGNLVAPEGYFVEFLGYLTGSVRYQRDYDGNLVGSDGHLEGSGDIK